MQDVDDLIGKQLGAYTIVEKLGAGGMAVVYKAYQASLHRYAAVKVLREDLGSNQEFIARFQREAQSIASLSHPNILHVYDAGIAYGRYFIAMDYVEGGSLKDLIDSGSLRMEQSVSIAAQLADALDYAHRQGVVHRDVKPANVLMATDASSQYEGSGGRPVLTDFGIAKALYEVTTLTRTGTAIGTPEYMAPEQFMGGAIDGRTDVYALGIVLYEMLAGRPPFNAPTPMSTLYKQANEPPAPLRTVVAVPAWLESIVGKALAKRPDDRYQRAGDLAADLRRQPKEGQPTSGWAGPVPLEVGQVQASRPYGSSAFGDTAVAGLPYGQGPARASYEPASSAALASAPRLAYYNPPPPSPAEPEPVYTQPQAGRPRRGLMLFLVGAIAVLVLGLAAAVIYMALGGAGQRPAGDASPIIVVVTSTMPPGLTDVPAVVQSPAPTPEAITALPSPTVMATLSLPVTVAPASTEAPTATTEAPTATQEPTQPPATTQVPTRATTAVPAQPGLLADFEAFGTWKRGDEPNGTFTQSNAQVHQGSYSGKLDYQFGNASNDYVVFQQSHAIGGQPASLMAWVYGDGAGHFLNAWIKDHAGQTWQVPLGTVTHTGWQQMTGRLDPSQAWPWTHISGPDNGAVDYPVSFVALVLDDKPDTFTGSGTIYIDELRAEAGSGSSAPGGPTAQAPTAALTGAPSATEGPPAGLPAVTGRIAFSAAGLLHVVSAQTGQDTIGAVPNMRQPDFRSDGQLLIANGEGGGQDSLWTVNSAGGVDREQTTHPDDFYPVFSPSNPSRFAFDSTRMGKGQHNLFVGDLNSRKTDDQRAPLSFGGGLIIGSHPVWLADDRLVYTGCDYGWGSGANCGLFVVPSWGGQPTRILEGGLTELATDAYGARILVTSQRDGNWELYVINSNGSGLRNLSTGSSSNDGLGTFSPDGQLVAFVSDRGGRWAVWAVSPDGSGLTHLFDLPARLTGTWTDERISWGP